jgi:hypothetical protein
MSIGDSAKCFINVACNQGVSLCNQGRQAAFLYDMTIPESAEVLGLSERTVKQYWSQARTWLYREIQDKKA